MDKGPSGKRALLLLTGAGLLFAGNRLLKQRKTLDLQDRVVLITGSSRGLGFAIAEEFARQGARLVISGRNEEKLEHARQELSSNGTQVLAVPCDITDRSEVQKMINQATSYYGKIDILVNNAGVITVGPFKTLNLDDFEQSMNTMYWGTLYATLAVLPQMFQRHEGSIVNITSIGGKVSVPHLLPYSAAKFATVGLSEGLREELAPEGIRVTTVIPGLMRTGSHVNAIFKGDTHREDYTWFSLSASSPLSSVSAQHAANLIVKATKEGKGELIISPQAQVLARLAGLFPGTVHGILSGISRFMPHAESPEQNRYTGKESSTPISNSFLNKLGDRAAHQYNQLSAQDDTQNN